jgi:hypothetical protein
MADQGIVAAAVKMLRESATVEGIYQARKIPCPMLTRAIDELVAGLSDGSSIKTLEAVHSITEAVDSMKKPQGKN